MCRLSGNRIIRHRAGILWRFLYNILYENNGLIIVQESFSLYVDTFKVELVSSEEKSNLMTGPDINKCIEEIE